jgi:hypothetical protein
MNDMDEAVSLWCIYLQQGPGLTNDRVKVFIFWHGLASTVDCFSMPIVEHLPGGYRLSWSTEKYLIHVDIDLDGNDIEWYARDHTSKESAVGSVADSAAELAEWFGRMKSSSAMCATPLSAVA